MVLYAAFIVTSGVVYFVFMTAWTSIFALVGFSRIATMILGGALLAMGLVNLKETVWFKKGPSLLIAGRAKPGLLRRMRAIAGAASVPAALGGVLALAFVVNLIELGCTIGPRRPGAERRLWRRLHATPRVARTARSWRRSPP